MDEMNPAQQISVPWPDKFDFRLDHPLPGVAGETPRPRMRRKAGPFIGDAFQKL